MGGVKAPRLPYLTAAPVVALGIAWAVTVLLGWAGWDLWWRSEPLNLSEAVVLRDRGEIGHLLRAGADPRQPEVIREGLLRPDPMLLTPIEAAMLTGRPELVRLLIADLELDPSEWCHLWGSTTNPNIRAVLLDARPSAAPAACPIEKGAARAAGAEPHEAS